MQWGTYPEIQFEREIYLPDMATRYFVAKRLLGLPSDMQDAATSPGTGGVVSEKQVPPPKASPSRLDTRSGRRYVRGGYKLLDPPT